METISGGVLIWRLSAEARGHPDEESVERVEHRAERLVGVAFMILAACVAFEAVRSLLTARLRSRVLSASSLRRSRSRMMWLAREKRATGEALGSRALIADAQQTYACLYLSVITLTGLGSIRSSAGDGGIRWLHSASLCCSSERA